MNSASTERGQRVELKFGTSGLRGLAAQMTDREVYVNTLGFALYLLETGQATAGDVVAVGRDLRHVDPSTGQSSSPRIASAVCRALQDSRLLPRNCGALPTPALAAYALHGSARPLPCIMVTGSHIPADRNGIKFYKPEGELMKRDESAVLAAVAKARRELEGSTLFGPQDQFVEPTPLPIETSNAASFYLSRYLEAFAGSRPLEGKKIALFEHSAVGRDLLATLLERLGAQVERLGRTEDFVSVDTEDVSPADEQRYRDMVLGASAFALVSTDGDSDRPLIVDERGRFHRGDAVGLVTAEALKARFAAVPVSATDAIDRRAHLLKQRGQTLEISRTRIGSPYVIEAMEEALARGLAPVVGWEANGGFLLGSSVTLGRASLLPLPTRDAVLPIVAVLVGAASQGRAVSEVFDELPQRATAAGLLDDFPVEASRRIVSLLHPGDQTAFHVSLEGLEPRPETVSSCCRAIEQVFAPHLGFGPVSWLNWLDGVRIGFENGDIAHIRPSGNAPQLRLYAIADAKERAQRIVALGIGRCGMLRQLQAMTQAPIEGHSLPAACQDPRLTALEELRQVVARSAGPRQVLAIVNGGDARLVEQELRHAAREVFRAVGQVAIVAHEEKVRRGQFLGLLDAVAAFEQREAFGPGVALGIMLPGKGTRLSPITQRLHGIKPFFPTPLRASRQGRLLSGAAASLYTWTLVAHHLERLGFHGIAWKWGDEPQLPTSCLADLDWDLSSVDAVRFGSKVRMTEDLARNKEWLRADAQGNLMAQLRRRSRQELCLAMGLDPEDANAAAHVHIGSPALSYLFLEEARAIFGQWDGWLDVDGYLFEALTSDAASWQREIERDAGLAALLRERPSFYAAVQKLRERIEQRRGHALRIKVIDFGQGLFWADLGQLSRARDAFCSLLDPGLDGELSRELMGLRDAARDRHGNLVVGVSEVPKDGRVRDCVVVDSVLGQGVVGSGAVIVESFIGEGQLGKGSLALRSHVKRLSLAQGAFCFESACETLAVEPNTVHTSIPVDPSAQTLCLESFRADMGVDPGSGATYNEPAFGNPASFAALFDRMRQRDTRTEALERRIAVLKAQLAR